MIALTPQMRIFVAVEPADFRNGIDGLCALCRSKLFPGSALRRGVRLSQSPGAWAQDPGL